MEEMIGAAAEPEVKAEEAEVSEAEAQEAASAAADIFAEAVIPEAAEKKPRVEGVRPAEGIPLPDKEMGRMGLWERARFFADDPDGYRTARSRI